MKKRKKKKLIITQAMYDFVKSERDRYEEDYLESDRQLRICKEDFEKISKDLIELKQSNLEDKVGLLEKIVALYEKTQTHKEVYVSPTYHNGITTGTSSTITT
jgi:hypothetical protein